METETRRVVEPWMRDAPRQRTPGVLYIREYKTTHILMVTSEFYGDGEREKDYQ